MRLILASLLFCAPAFAGGTIARSTLSSDALGVTKAYRIYLPEGYASTTTRYPVIYLLHGWGVTENSWADTLHLGDTADRLHLQALVVMPDGDRSVYANSVTSTNYDKCLRDTAPVRNKTEPRGEFCVRTPRYENYIVRDLVHHVDKTYRTIATREGRGISGESAAGYGAMAIALRNRSLFSSVASHSGFLTLLYDGPHPYDKSKMRVLSKIDPHPQKLEVQEIFGFDIENWRAHDPYFLAQDLRNNELAIYFDCGLEDDFGFQDHARAFHDRLTSLGIRHEFHLVHGQHDDQLFSARLLHGLTFHATSFSQRGVYPRGPSAAAQAVPGT
jgi:S-formylglutathione hydrolase FrmB